MAFMSVNKKRNGRQKDGFPQILNIRLELPCLINCLWLLSVHSFQKKKKNVMRTYQVSGPLLDAEMTKLSYLYADDRIPGKVLTCIISIQ